MIHINDLKNAYNRLLDSHPPISFSGQANDAFELYTLSLILQAAKDENGDINFESSLQRSKPHKLCFRTSPGNIFSSARDFSHAIIRFDNGMVFEAHIGVYVQGLAGVLHECDVLVINATEGNFCRQNKVHPKKKSIALATECKFYTTPLGISLGRQFLGMTMDLGSEGRFFISNSNSNGKSIDRLLATYKRQRFFGLSPLDKDKENQVIALFRNTFRNLIAKHR